ncbi:Ankyrin-2, partial [Gryllus bimaculatus]
EGEAEREEEKEDENAANGEGAEHDEGEQEAAGSPAEEGTPSGQEEAPAEAAEGPGDAPSPVDGETKAEDEKDAGEQEGENGESEAASKKSDTKYHTERLIFQQLLELKRLQIRAGRANEHVLVKRLVDEHRRAGPPLGTRAYEGPYTFRGFENNQRPAPPHSARGRWGRGRPREQRPCRRIPAPDRPGVISLPTDKLDRNKRYYVTFTIKGGGGSAGTGRKDPLKKDSGKGDADEDQPAPQKGLRHHHAESL